MSVKGVITRYPPSPTGPLHIGRVRTMLYNYLFTKQNDGKIILRFEDTDAIRSKTEFESNIIESLKWLGLTYDEGPLKQTDRITIYKKYINDLITRNVAYVSKEEVTKENQRPEVIRFRNPNKLATFTDLLRGEISFDTTDLGDFIIARSFDEPLYHLTVAIDDHEMSITHVIRGEEHISNTPRQILIQEAIGAKRPIYAHMPLILAPDKSKLSARHGAKSVLEYRDEGYLPEAIINFVAFMGWHPKDDREVLSMDELLADFGLARVQKAGAVFDIVKLNWLNREHMKRLAPEELQKQSAGFFPNKESQKFLSILLERIDKFGDITTLLAPKGEYNFLISKPEYTTELLLGKSGITKEEVKQNLTEVKKLIETLNEDKFSAEDVKEKIWDYATQEGRGKVLWPMRVALSGRERSPDPFTLASSLNKTESLTRLQSAIDMLY